MLPQLGFPTVTTFPMLPPVPSAAGAPGTPRYMLLAVVILSATPRSQPTSTLDAPEASDSGRSLRRRATRAELPSRSSAYMRPVLKAPPVLMKSAGQS